MVWNQAPGVELARPPSLSLWAPDEDFLTDALYSRQNPRAAHHTSYLCRLTSAVHTLHFLFDKLIKSSFWGLKYGLKFRWVKAVVCDSDVRLSCVELGVIPVLTFGHQVTFDRLQSCLEPLSSFSVYRSTHSWPLSSYLDTTLPLKDAWVCYWLRIVCGCLCILARFPFKANGGLCVLSLCFCASHSVYG